LWTILRQAVDQWLAAASPLLLLWLLLLAAAIDAAAAAAAAVSVCEEELEAHPPHCQL
jgi:hypothetical protein